MSPSRGQDPVPTVPRQPPACPVLRDPLTWAPAPRAPAPWERALRCAGTSRPHPCCVFLPCGERWCGLSVGQAPETPPRRFGQIQSIRMLPGKRCAFINFKQKTAAEAAYEDMLVSTGLGGPTAPPGPCARRGCSSTDIFLPRTLTWREAGWCCSSSTPPTPRRAPGSAPRPAARGGVLPGGAPVASKPQQLTGSRASPLWWDAAPCTLGPRPGAAPAPSSAVPGLTPQGASGSSDPSWSRGCDLLGCFPPGAEE